MRLSQVFTLLRRVGKYFILQSTCAAGKGSLAILGPIDRIFIFGERHQRLGDKAAGTIVIAD
jgi:uncharacterized RDD family membrane protein YckC